MKSVGNWLIWLVLIITGFLFVRSKVDINEIGQMPWTSASQLLSLMGTVLMTLSFVLSSRARFLEDLFGGLDKVMKIHHIVGGISFLMIINHPLLLAVDALPNYQVASKYFWLSGNVSYNLGVGALYVMILTLVLTFLVKLPYDIWLKTHDFMGLVLMLASLHVYMISSDVSRYQPLRVWMFSFLALGLFSFVYKVVLYAGLGPKYKYKVKEVKKLGDVLEIYLQPLTDKLQHKPGQFVFVNFETGDLLEKHPFTISSSPESDYIRISVKALGDYTLKLRKLAVGVLANVWGPYGRFYKGFEKGEKDVVFVGGGIGITPFLSMLDYEQKKPMDRKITLFYGANSAEDAVYDNELTILSEKMNNLSYFRHFGGQKPRISIEVILEKLGNLSNKNFYVCGPGPMMESMAAQLKTHGVRNNNIIIEDFAFKE